MIRKPFQRVPNSASIHDPGADTPHSVPEVEAVDGFRVARSDPAESDHDGPQTQHESGPDSIYQVAFKRNEPGLEGNEQSERPLHGNETDVQMSLDGFGEESPCVLQIRDRHHGDNAGNQLNRPEA